MLNQQNHQIRLVLSKGLWPEAALYLHNLLKVIPDHGLSRALADPDEEGYLERQLQAVGLLQSGKKVSWASEAHAAFLRAKLAEAGVTLVWRGEADYPPRLLAGLGASAPAWVWLAGECERLTAPTCAVIGSRESAPEFLSAARLLGRALAKAGRVVVSGMAPGADTAAHEGALEGMAGTLAVPARGILKAGLSFCRTSLDRGRQGAMTYLALDRPDSAYSTGLAIRRSGVIAALSDGLVLVASDLMGSSAYGVNWALEHGRPLWCFEAGADTPPANDHLLRSGLAQPLRLAEAPEAWAAQIVAELDGVETVRREQACSPRMHACRHGIPEQGFLC